MPIMIANVLDADNLQWLRDNLGKTRFVDDRQRARVWPTTVPRYPTSPNGSRRGKQ